MPIGLEQWRAQIGALEAQRYRYLSRAARKAARGGRSRVCRVSGRGMRCWAGFAVGVTLLGLVVSFSLLLLRAGDVERNPGPLTDELLSTVDDSELAVDDLRDVYREVWTLAEMWRNIHLSLGLPAALIDIISGTFPCNLHGCFREVVLKWLQKEYNFQRHGLPTWRMLVQAVATGGNDCVLAEKIAKAHQAAVASPPTPSSLQAAGSARHTTTPEKRPDPRKTHPLCAMFAEIFGNITKMLDKSVNVDDLKEFLHDYCHPLYPEQLYIDPKVYTCARTTAEVLDALFPQFINPMKYFLLEDIIKRFQCDGARRLLQEYTEQLYVSRKRKLSTFPDLVTDEEAEQFTGVKKAKVRVQRDLDDTTVKYLVVEKATGVNKKLIVYCSEDFQNW